MKKLRNLIILIMILLVTVLSNQWETGETSGVGDVTTITRVVDGDTVVTEEGEKIRIIGINTPEIGKRTEPYGAEAKKYAEEMLLDRKVYLEADVSDRDQYGRLLRHVWLKNPERGNFEEDNYGAVALRNGYAQVYTFPPDVKYEKKFLKLSREARREERGLWGIDINGTTRGEVPRL